ncbi:MAG: helix-turn-helix domain-containing protein [Nitrosomonas sp.]|nr:helix-turn-helix domain-containing protein [Nitrosomonas sp.]
MQENTITLPRLMTEQDLAKYLSKSISWCQQSRWNGAGPKFVKLGRHVRYRVEDVLEWVNAGERTSTQRA